MTEEEKIPDPQSKPDINIEKSRDESDLIHYRNFDGTTSPNSWQPIKDETDPNPPSGGSGVGDDED